MVDSHPASMSRARDEPGPGYEPIVSVSIAQSLSCSGPRGTGLAFPVRPPRRVHPAIELGNEPPLNPSASPATTDGHVGWTLRWLGGSVLTGLAGALLLGSAIYGSSDGEMSFASLAERAPSMPQRASGGAARKGDKLIRAETVAAAKQSFRAPMTLRAGDREVIKVRNFVRISTALSLTSGVAAADIPPFNPLRFFSDGAAERISEAPPETSDAEVSVVKSDISLLAVDPGTPVLSDGDVAAQLADEARARGEAGRGPVPPLPATLMLPRSASAAPLGVDPASRPDAAFRSIEVRVMPENVSNFDKTPPGANTLGARETTVVVRRGDSPEGMLQANGAGPDEVRAIMAALGRDKPVAITEGMQVRLLLAPATRPGAPRSIARVVLISERGIQAIAASDDRGAFVSVAPPQAEAALPQAARPAPRPAASEEEEEEEDPASGVTLYDSLYETALKQDLSRQTVEDLVRIFGYDVDFQRRVTPGDTFELFYATDEEGGAERLEILSATLTTGDDVHRVYRFQGQDGTVDYFDEAGRSLKKFIIRKPVVDARMSSPFGNRFHPILGYAKLHTGVDWAAKTGTPIMAAGNGTIVKAEMSSGYGRRTEIQHANGYVTAYNHQSGFARGIVPGARVRQGQIIGYVGSTGLSTGAHLHYEVIVNGRFVDPMRIKVPRGRELDGRALVEFGRQRDQVTTLMQKAANPNQVAQRDVR